jgi:hypothetical protein
MAVHKGVGHYGSLITLDQAKPTQPAIRALARTTSQGNTERPATMLPASLFVPVPRRLQLHHRYR